MYLFVYAFLFEGGSETPVLALRMPLKTKENIYKLGKTKQENLKRLKQYGLKNQIFY